MRRAACAARYIMQTACMAVNDATTFRAFTKKNSHFLTVLGHMRLHENVNLSVIYSFLGAVLVEKLIYRCAFRWKCIGVHVISAEIELYERLILVCSPSKRVPRERMDSRRNRIDENSSPIYSEKYICMRIREKRDASFIL